jgi:hypothetical protein
MIFSPFDRLIVQVADSWIFENFGDSGYEGEVEI